MCYIFFFNILIFVPRSRINKPLQPEPESHGLRFTLNSVVPVTLKSLLLDIVTTSVVTVTTSGRAIVAMQHSNSGQIILTSVWLN